MANQHRPYTPQDNAWLLAHYATASRAAVLAALPGRSWDAIQNQASKLGASGRPRVVPLPERTAWHPANLALLSRHYPDGGSAAAAEATGLSQQACREQACRLGLRYVRKGRLRDRLKAARPPKAAPAPKPVRAKKAPVAAPLLAVKRSPATPNLNVAKEARRRAEEAPKRAAVVTAEEIRRLPYNHPGRLAYLHGGQAGWLQWKGQVQ